MLGEIQFVSPYMAIASLINLGVLDGSCTYDLEAARAGEKEAKLRLTDALESVRDKAERGYTPPTIDDYTRIEGVDVERIADAGRNPLESSVRFFTMYNEVLTPKNLDTGLVGDLAELALNEDGIVAEKYEDVSRISSNHHVGRVMSNLISYMAEDTQASFLKLYMTCVKELMPIVKNPVAARAHAGILTYNAMEMDVLDDGNEKAISRHAAEILPDIRREIISYGDGSNELYTDAFDCIRDKVGDDIAHEIALNSAMMMTAMFEPVEGTYEKWVDLTADTYLELHAMLSGTEIGDIAKGVALIASLDEYSSLAAAKEKAIQYKNAIIEIRNVARSVGVVGKAASDIALEAFAGTAGLEKARIYARNAAKEYLKTR